MFCTQSVFGVYCWLIREHKMDPTFRQYRQRPNLLRHKLSPSDDRHRVGFDKIDEVSRNKKKIHSVLAYFHNAKNKKCLTYFFLKALTSSAFSRYVVKSLIVSDDVVPLIVRSRKISPTQSSNLFQRRCVVSRGRLFRSTKHFPMLIVFVHTTTSNSWSSSNRCKSNCSSHFARGEGLLLYFSLPSLRKVGKFSCKFNLFHHSTNLNLTNGSSPASIAGRPFASTSNVVTTELHICDFRRFDASANFGLRWKYWKYVKVLCYEQTSMEKKVSQRKAKKKIEREEEIFFCRFPFHLSSLFFFCLFSCANEINGKT